jgi:hypothetical protein
VSVSTSLFSPLLLFPLIEFQTKNRRRDQDGCSSGPQKQPLIHQCLLLSSSPLKTTIFTFHVSCLARSCPRSVRRSITHSPPLLRLLFSSIFPLTYKLRCAGGMMPKQSMTPTMSLLSSLSPATKHALQHDSCLITYTPPSSLTTIESPASNTYVPAFTQLHPTVHKETKAVKEASDGSTPKSKPLPNSFMSLFSSLSPSPTKPTCQKRHARKRSDSAAIYRAEKDLVENTISGFLV